MSAVACSCTVRKAATLLKPARASPSASPSAPVTTIRRGALGLSASGAPIRSAPPGAVGLSRPSTSTSLAAPASRFSCGMRAGSMAKSSTVRSPRAPPWTLTPA
mgnify:CR=1 FL=1